MKKGEKFCRDADHFINDVLEKSRSYGEGKYYRFADIASQLDLSVHANALTRRRNKYPGHIGDINDEWHVSVQYAKQIILSWIYDSNRLWLLNHSKKEVGNGNI